MTNIAENISFPITILNQKNSASLDTLEQLSPSKRKSLDKSNENDVDISHEKFKNRQMAKAISNAVVFKFVDIDSPLKKSYWSTYHCNEYLTQSGNKIKAKYCGKRWCTVCSRIMTAKMINQYGPEVAKFDDLQFVTLTAKNVSGKQLSNEIDRFNVIWRKIYKRLRKQSSDFTIKGLKKIECTIGKDKLYNPHYHLLVDGKHVAKEIVRLWLEYNPTAGYKGQDIRKADEKSLIELFKYATKQIYNDDIPSQKLDVIYRAIRGRRIYDSFGINKYVPEDIEGIRSNIITFKPYQNEVYVWDNDLRNWISNDGELFVNCDIPKPLKIFLDKHKPKDELNRLFDVDEIIKNTRHENSSNKVETY